MPELSANGGERSAAGRRPVGAGGGLERWVVPLGVAAYLARVAWAVRGHWNLINPDAICYIRQATYLLQGRSTDVVAGYWSPLVSWCLAPLLAAGVDGLHGLYVVVASWGAVLVAASGLLVRRLTDLPAAWRLAVLLLVGDATLRWGATGFPDVILAACLTGAAALLCHPRFLERPALQVACGAVGGCGYLGKAYGLPYFVLFVPLGLLFLQHARRGEARAWRRAATAWAVTMLTFAAVSLPWVAALSWKFQRPTFGLVGGINHAIIGPDDFARDELWQPVPGRITVWEIPETRRYRFWSPLESAAALRHQVAYSWATARKLRDSLANFDFMGLSLGLVLAAPFLLLALDRRQQARRAGWGAAVMLTYSLPFILVYYDYRYVTPFLKPLSITLCAGLAYGVGRSLEGGAALAGASRSLRRLAAWALTGLVAVSFLLHLNVPFRPYQVQEVDGTPYNNIVTDVRLHRGLARQIQAAGLEGPVAATEYWGGLYVAFALDSPFVGQPAGATFTACRDEMRARGVRLFLMDPGWRHADTFLTAPGWREALTLTVGEGQEVLVLAATD